MGEKTNDISNTAADVATGTAVASGTTPGVVAAMTPNALDIVGASAMSGAIGGLVIGLATGSKVAGTLWGGIVGTIGGVAAVVGGAASIPSKSSSTTHTP